LAFNAARQDAEDHIEVKTYVYSLTTDTLVYIPTVGRPYQIAWSQDSTNLAVLSWLPCDDVGYVCHQNILETFSIPDGVRQSMTSEIDDVFQPCHLQWAPDGQHMAFEMDCADMYQYLHDLFIWDVAQPTISRLTGYTVQPGEQLQSFDVTYDTIWYDPQTLLVGIGASPFLRHDPEETTIRTSAYTIAGEETEVATNVAADWALNPVTDEIAFRAEIVEAMYDEGTDEVKYWRGFIVQDASVQIATFDGQNFSIVANAPAGCNLDWSPDGVYLAYERRGAPGPDRWWCREPLEGLAFVNAQTGQLAEYSLLPFRTDEVSVRSIGWILVIDE
jgi:hypothetical protein